MKLKLIKEGIDDVINYNAKSNVGTPKGGVYGRTQDRYNTQKNDVSRRQLKYMYFDEFNNILKDHKLSDWRDGQWLKWYFEDKDLAEKFLDKLSELTDGKVTKDNFKITRKFIELVDNNNYTLNDIEDLIKLIMESGKLSDKINQKIDDKSRKDTIDSLKDRIDYLKNNEMSKELEDFTTRLANAVRDVLTDKFKVETEVTTHIDPRWDDESSKDDTLKLSKSKYEGPFRVNMRTRKEYDDRMNKLLKKLFSGRQIATLDLDDVGNIKRINFDYSQLEKIPDELKKALGDESFVGENMKTEGKFTDLILDIAAKASKDPAMFEKVAHEMFSDEQRKGLTKDNLESRLLAKVNRGEVDPNDLMKFVESKKNEEWNEVKVYRVKDILNKAIGVLDDYDDNDTVICSPNTYGLGKFLAIPGVGFIDLDNMDIESSEEDESESKKVSESLSSIFSRVSTKSESFTYKK